MEKRGEEVLQTLRELGRELGMTPGMEKETSDLAYVIGYLESAIGLPISEDPW